MPSDVVFFKYIPLTGSSPKKNQDNLNKILLKVTRPLKVSKFSDPTKALREVLHHQFIKESLGRPWREPRSPYGRALYILKFIIGNCKQIAREPW